MPDDKPLDATEAYDRLHAANEALGDAPGCTPLIDNALKAARRAVVTMQLVILKGTEPSPGDLDGDDAPAVRPQRRSHRRP